MKTTFSSGVWIRHVLHTNKDGDRHWHLAARSDGFRHPHWSRFSGHVVDPRERR